MEPYDADGGNNSCKDLWRVQGHQPRPVLPTPHLNDKDQFPGLVKGLSPKLVLDSTFLPLIPAVDLWPGYLPMASFLRYVPFILVLVPFLNLDWHSAFEVVLPLPLLIMSPCNPSSSAL